MKKIIFLCAGCLLSMSALAGDNANDAVNIGLSNSKMTGVCSGSIIASGWVLTAAHCTDHCADGGCRAEVTYGTGGGISFMSVKGLEEGTSIFTKSILSLAQFIASGAGSVGDYNRDSSADDIALIKIPGLTPSGTKKLVEISPATYQDAGGSYCVSVLSAQHTKVFKGSFFQNPLPWDGPILYAVDNGSDRMTPGYSGSVVYSPSGEVVGVISMMSPSSSTVGIAPINKSNLAFILSHIK